MNNATAGTSQQYVLRKLLRHRSATIGASIILFFIIIAILAPLITTHDPRHATLLNASKAGRVRTISAPTVSDVTSSAGLFMERVYL